MWRHFCVHPFWLQHRNNCVRTSGIVEKEADSCNEERLCGQGEPVFLFMSRYAANWS